MGARLLASASHPMCGVHGLVAVGYVRLHFSLLLQLATRAVPALAALAAPWVVTVLVLRWVELGAAFPGTASVSSKSDLALGSSND